MRNFEAFVPLLLIASVGLLSLYLWRRNQIAKSVRFSRRPSAVSLDPPRTRRKPVWVIHEVLRLRALMGKQIGCRKIANTFNRLHAPVTIGKTFVAETIKSNQYLLMQIARELRSKQPVPVAINAVWAMDMSFITDDSKHTNAFVGILDHGSRVCVRLAVLVNRRAWTLLGHLCFAIGKYGKPKALRADNEAVFASFVFRTFLKLAGIKRQTIPTCAPWCNGRVERFFGTVKPWLRQLAIPSGLELQGALSQARDFYNHCRTHQNLAGLTPAEVWQGLTVIDIWHTKPKQVTLVQALDGVLVGYHLRS